MKEIKVRLYAHENDSYNELYKVIAGNTKEKYFARHTYNSGVWYFVSDPLGYCELSHVCPGDYIFVVCDKNGAELFKDSNGEISNPFPTLERQAVAAWDGIKAKYPTTDGLNDWLQSFLTAEIKEQLKKEPCIETNWVWSWFTVVNKEVIAEFGHLGEQYCIYKVTNKHKYCGCEWIEYFAGAKKMNEYGSYIKHFGNFYNAGYRAA